MNTLKQFLGGALAGAIVIALIASGIFLSAGDASVAFRPTPTAPPPTETALPSLQPSPTTQPPKADTPTALPLTLTTTPTLVSTGVCPRPTGWIDYTVVSGDDLGSVAVKFNTNIVLLAVGNCLRSPNIVPGQILFVPPITPTPTATVTLTPTPCGPPLGWPIYTVRAGDTLGSIAVATGTSVQQIMLANCLSTDRIFVGQRLFVPRRPAAPTAFPTATRRPTPLPTWTWTPSPTFTTQPSATPISVTPTIGVPTLTPTPSSTPTLAPTDTATPTPSHTPTLAPIDTPTSTPTTIIIQSPTPTPTVDQPPTTPPTFTPTPIPTSLPPAVTLPATTP